MASSFLRITVLLWVDILAAYAISTLITYLTDVWKLNFTHAAAIVNVFWGLTAILPFTLQYIVDTLMGNYWMLLLTSFAYSLGLGFLSMSTPPVLSRADGTCSEYKPKCIGEAQKTLFGIALALVALGMSGHLTSLKALIEEHKRSSNAGFSYLGFFGLVIVTIVGAVAIPFIKPWSIRFGITAICSVIATILFWTGSYSYVRAQGSPLTSVLRVIVASASKAFQKFPIETSQLHERHDNLGSHKISRTHRLRCLDKAAIILPDEKQNTKWKLCTVTEVEETKTIICMIPICTTFFILGVVSSIGNTYFLEQANRMNQKLGRVKVPLTILIFFRDQAKSQFASCYLKMAYYNGSSRPSRYATQIGIAVSMIVAVHCCITAAKVENRRLRAVSIHGLLDKPKERIPMSMFWLLPQFLLLGGLDGISHESIGLFFIDQGPASMDKYMAHFAIAVLGVGNMGSVLSVFLVDKISSWEEHPSWFQDTLNRSRLDKYYWVLAAFTTANMVLYILVSIWCHINKGLRSENMEVKEPNNQI